MIDLNHTATKQRSANDLVNAVVDTATNARQEEPRQYLGASAIGHECLRKIQWDWQKPKPIEARTRRIFNRGHWIEREALAALMWAGFEFKRGEGFTQLDGIFRGHTDGRIVRSPLPEVSVPCLWECKGLGDAGWKKLAKDGLSKAYPQYADQVAVYQAYLDLTDNPCLFTAVNANTMEMLHLLIPFDPVRAQACSDRAVVVINATKDGETMPRVTSKPDDWRCKFCNHSSECWANG